MSADPRDLAVKQAVYSALAETGRAPEAHTLAVALSMSDADVRDAFARLHAQRLLVPEPNDPGRIRMAPPFSGVPTPFRVRAHGREYFANCVWDALGIPAALHVEAEVEASDAQTGEPIGLRVGADGPAPERAIAHFAVPAAHWWDDIIHT